MTDTTYKSYTGHGVGAGSLTAIKPPPACPGPIFEEERYSPSGPKYSVGTAYTSLRYSAITDAEFRTLCTKFGLVPSVGALVESYDNTIQIPQWGRTTFGIFDCTIDLPKNWQQMKYEAGFYRDVEFPVRNLVWASNAT